MSDRRRRPSFEDSYEHSYDHRGDTGKFGSIFSEDVGQWKVSADEHELCIVPYVSKLEENSIFRVCGLT